MGTAAALLEACWLDRDDDAPRLVWADHVGGERGELVVVQCDLARGGLVPAEAAARRRRERELIAQHGEAWSGGARVGFDVEFRRGFVEAAMSVVDTFVAQAAEAIELAPLLASLTLVAETRWAPERNAWSYPPAQVARLVESPAWSRLRGLHLVGRDEDGDAVCDVLARSGALGTLRAFGISSFAVTPRGVQALAASGAFAALDKLWLRDTGLDGGAWLAALRGAHLAAVALRRPVELAAILQALGAVVELELAHAAAGDLLALARSPLAVTLEALTLTGHATPIHALAAFPRLRSLDLRGVTTASEADHAALAAVGLPALRRIACGPVGGGALLAVARALGPQLELLDVSGAALAPDVLAELYELVAGELVVAPLWTPWISMLI